MSPTARILVADDWPAVTVTTTSDAQVGSQSPPSAGSRTTRLSR